MYKLFQASKPGFPRKISSKNLNEIVYFRIAKNGSEILGKNITWTFHRQNRYFFIFSRELWGYKLFRSIFRVLMIRSENYRKRFPLKEMIHRRIKEVTQFWGWKIYVGIEIWFSLVSLILLIQGCQQKRSNYILSTVSTTTNRNTDWQMWTQEKILPARDRSAYADYTR